MLKVCCGAIAALGMFAGVASASPLVSEPFSYPDGNLVGNDPAVGGVWAAFSGAGSLPVQVTSNTISIAQGAGSREDVNVPFEGGFVAARERCCIRRSS